MRGWDVGVGAGCCSCSCVAASLSFISIHTSMEGFDFLFKVVLLGGPGAGSTPIHRVLRLDDWLDARYSLPLSGPHRVICFASADHWEVSGPQCGMCPLLSPGSALDVRLTPITTTPYIGSLDHFQS